MKHLVYQLQLIYLNINTMKKILFAFSMIFAVVISSNQSMAQRRKGMSSQAKGALIGGGAGVAAGALIGHNVGGAVLGGALGAGGGYVVGNEIRRNKAKKYRAYRRTHSRTYYSRRHH